MERYYGVPAGGTYQTVEEEDTLSPNGKPVPKMAQMPDISVEVALSLRHDLQATIPRAEVKEIYAVVMSELEAFQEGCMGTIAGGCAEFNLSWPTFMTREYRYRRGKQQSNDIDIVISHPDLKSGGDKVKGLCTRFVQRLYKRGKHNNLINTCVHVHGFKGLVTHVMRKFILISRSKLQ